jgi:hypothetical protein
MVSVAYVLHVSVLVCKESNVFSPSLPRNYFYLPEDDTTLEVKNVCTRLRGKTLRKLV